jgi:predicted alpha/beta-hydrolase family hydrolase
MEKDGKRPDPPGLAQATVRAAVAVAAKACAGLPLIAGGKSFGGRMTSQAQAKAPLDGVKGIAFFAFPLHPAREPGTGRAAHLFDVDIPMLFLQGTRDALADVTLLKTVVTLRGTLHLAEGADHSFHVLKSSGRTDREVLAEILDAFGRWVDEVVLSSA